MTLLADDDVMRPLVIEDDLLGGLTADEKDKPAWLRPERSFATFTPVDLPRAGTLDEQLRAELSRDDGTPEWRAFVARAAKRRDIHI